MNSPWEDAERLELQTGDILMREGETTDAVFEVVDGTLEVLRGDPNAAHRHRRSRLDAR